MHTAVEFSAFRKLLEVRAADGVNLLGEGGDGSFLKYLHGTYVPKFGYAKFDSEHRLAGYKPLLEYFEKDPVKHRFIYVHGDADNEENKDFQHLLDETMKRVQAMLKTESNDVFQVVTDA